MKINERMTPKQSIIFVIIIAIAVFISMQVVHGQVCQIPQGCKQYYTPALKIIHLDPVCYKSVSVLLSSGYKLITIYDGLVYMTK
jgi:hypothetical protein